jgi:flagellar biosynthesis/type III secretory pathway M-ring protein FliF/YscJ
MKKKILIFIASACTIIIIALIFVSSKKGKDNQLFSRAERGDFEVIVAVTGELEAMNMEKIVAPRELSGELKILYRKGPLWIRENMLHRSTKLK